MINIMRKPVLAVSDRVGLNQASHQERQAIVELYKQYELRHEKTNVLVSDLVRHKPGCTATEDDKRLEISDLDIRGIVLSM